VRQGELDDVGGDTLRVTLDSVQRRLAASPPVGEPLKALGAWAILVHVGGILPGMRAGRLGCSILLVEVMSRRVTATPGRCAE